jgi:hypothetical protein
MKDMLVSVVIPVARDADTFDRCVEAVAQQAFPRKEIIVVCDAACGAMRLPEGIGELHVIRERQGSLPRLIDVGMRAARGQVKVLLMPYCIPVGADWLTELVKPFEDDGEQVGVVVSQCIAEDRRRAGLSGRLLDSVEPAERRNDQPGPAPQEIVSHLCDAHRAGLLADIGYFEGGSASASAQAISISVKVADAGYSILLSDAAAVSYNVPKSRRGAVAALRKALEYGRSDALLDRLYELHWLNAGVLAAALFSLLLLPIGAVNLPAATILSGALFAWAAFLSLRLPVIGWECPLALLNFAAFVAAILYVRDDWRPELFGKHVHPAIIRQWCWLAAMTGSDLLLVGRASLMSALRVLRQPGGALYAVPAFLVGLPYWLLTGVGYLYGLLAREPRRR